jgi:LL-diaminopimelate aminotransferase
MKLESSIDKIMENNMKTIPAQRMDLFQVHFFAELRKQISILDDEGKDVIRLDEGSPDLPPTDLIIDALYESARRPENHSYQSHRGSKELREAWAQMYERLYHVSVNPENEILPLLGTKEGIYHLPFVIINPGEIVLVPDPGYITYTRGTLMAGGMVHYVSLLPNNGYLLDFDSIPTDIASKAKLLWLNYPNNPTASLANIEFFRKAVAFALKHNIIICHDAAYSQIVYDQFPAPSILQIPDSKEVAIEFNTLSKSHNMAGWRVGAVLGNRKVVNSLFSLKTNVDSGQFRPIQDASTAALEGDQSWIFNRNEIYRKRRDIVVDALLTMGFNVSRPQGSLYVWCPILPGWRAEEFTSELLMNGCVSLTPGTVFGKNGEGFVRISLTAPEEQIKVAMDRIAEIIPLMKGRKTK